MQRCERRGPGGIGSGGGGPTLFVVEPKLDGERQQIHIAGAGGSIQYWSRRGLDHSSTGATGGGGYSVFDTVVREQVVTQHDGVILVGGGRRQGGRGAGSSRLHVACARRTSCGQLSSWLAGRVPPLLARINPPLCLPPAVSSLCFFRMASCLCGGGTGALCCWQAAAARCGLPPPLPRRGA